MADKIIVLEKGKVLNQGTNNLQMEFKCDPVFYLSGGLVNSIIYILSKLRNESGILTTYIIHASWKAVAFFVNYYYFSKQSGCKID